MFFWQICFQKLKFSRLTEIWYSGTTMYRYFEFNVYFFKNFVIHIFGGKFGPKIWSSSNLLELGTGVHCYILIRVLMFNFSKLLSFIFFWANLVPKSEVLQIGQYLIQRYISYYTLNSMLMLHLIQFCYL